LKIIIEKHREFNIETHLAFRLQKTFDKVNRNKLIEILTGDNIPNQLITTIYEIYKHNLIAVRLQAETSEWRIMNYGVRQGCSLSPLLFTRIYEQNYSEMEGGPDMATFQLTETLTSIPCYLQMIRYSWPNLKMIYNTQYTI
jgi:hypothetical protein